MKKFCFHATNDSYIVSSYLVRSDTKAETYSVDGINLLPPLILLPLDPVLIQVVEQLIDISRSIRISFPLLRIVFQQLNIG